MPPWILQSGVGHPRQHFRGVELGRGDLAVGFEALIEAPSRSQGEPVGGVDLCRHVGDGKADALEAADLLTELLARDRPLNSEVEGAASTAYTEGGYAQASGVEPGVGHFKTAVEPAENLLITQAATVEFEDVVVVAAVRQ